MSNSSQPKGLSNDLTNDILITAGGAGLTSFDTITITGADYASGSAYTYNSTYDFSSVITTNSVGTYTINSGMSPSTIDSITLNGLDAGQYTFKLPEEWIDSFPTWSRVEDMCKQYPGLKIAFDNFKVFYEMVKDDYDNPTPKK